MYAKAMQKEGSAKWGRRWVGAMLLGAMLGALALRATVWIVAAHSIPATADEGIMMLQAKGLLESSDAPSFQAKQNPRGVMGRFPLLFMAEPYLFPLESYLAAPLTPWLPRTTLAARVVPFIMGLAGVLFLLLIFRRWGGLLALWPAVLLVLFPSAYLLIFQAAFGLPSYPSFLLFSAVVILLAAMHQRRAGPSVAAAFFAGLLAGLVNSVTLVALPLLVLVGAMVILADGWRKAVSSAPAFAAGALAGFAPFLLAKRLYPGAFGAVAGTLPISDALRRLISPTLDFTVPTVLGLRCCLFPDTQETFTLLPPRLLTALLVLCGLVLVAATVLCVVRFVARWVRRRWPTLDLLDVFVGLSWMCLILFLLNRRSHSSTFRYLLYMAWAFPAVLGGLYLAAGRVGRALLGTLAVLLVVVNVATSAALLELWSAPDFARSLKLFDLGPPLKRLEELGIDRCYATYFDAYRINYHSDERVLCSQPLNERFPGWPLPYKEAVDAATNVAVLCAPGYRFFPWDFERALDRMRMGYRRETCGDYMVYTDFQPLPDIPADPIPAAELTITTGRQPENAGVLNDGNYWTRWRSRSPQEEGDWMEVQWAAPVTVARLVLFYSGYPHDAAKALRVRARIDGGWTTIAASVPLSFDEFELRHGHPVWGNLLQTIRIEPILTDALRIEIAEPNTGRDWTVGEIEVFAVRAALDGASP